MLCAWPWSRSLRRNRPDDRLLAAPKGVDADAGRVAPSEPTPCHTRCVSLVCPPSRNSARGGAQCCSFQRVGASLRITNVRFCMMGVNLRHCAIGCIGADCAYACSPHRVPLQSMRSALLAPCCAWDGKHCALSCGNAACTGLFLSEVSCRGMRGVSSKRDGDTVMPSVAEAMPRGCRQRRYRFLREARSRRSIQTPFVPVLCRL